MAEKEVRQEEASALVAAVQKGDPGAFGELLERYSALITRMINSFSVTSELRGEEKDDLRQEASLCLYNAAMKFDTEQKNVTFGLFAKICLKRRLISAARRAARKSRKKASLSSVRSDAPDPSRREESPRAMENALKILSQKEKAVFALYADGHSYGDIARQMRCSVKSVDNALCRARKKLREYLAQTGEQDRIRRNADR